MVTRHQQPVGAYHVEHALSGRNRHVLVVVKSDRAVRVTDRVDEVVGDIPPDQRTGTITFEMEHHVPGRMTKGCHCGYPTDHAVTVLEKGKFLGQRRDKFEEHLAVLRTLFRDIGAGHPCVEFASTDHQFRVRKGRGAVHDDPTDMIRMHMSKCNDVNIFWRISGEREMRAQLPCALVAAKGAKAGVEEDKLGSGIHNGRCESILQLGCGQVCSGGNLGNFGLGLVQQKRRLDANLNRAIKDRRNLEAAQFEPVNRVKKRAGKRSGHAKSPINFPQDCTFRGSRARRLFRLKSAKPPIKAASPFGLNCVYRAGITSDYWLPGEGNVMATIKEKPIWNFKINGEQLTKTKSTASARGKDYIIDEPIQRGGTDLGPMPVEYVFMGLSGCTHVISNKLATANGITFSDMDIDIAVTMDSHGTRLINPIDIPFPEVNLTITANYEGPREGAVEVVRKLRHHCAVSKMLQESGTRVTETWILNGEEFQSS